MIRSSHSQLCNKSNCSVKLQDELSDHNPRRIPAHDFTFNIYKLSYLVNRTENQLQFCKKKKITILVIFCRTAILQNNSQCLLLNILTNATRDIFQFVRNENTKNKHAGIKREKKVK